MGTYAAVAVNTSTLLAFVKTATLNENAAVNNAISPSLAAILWTMYSTAIDSTGSTEDRTILIMLAGASRWALS